jgi:uncharacterized hydrophobic protein (TIGR00271 family)
MVKKSKKEKNNTKLAGDDILKVKKSDQYRTAEELMEKSEPNRAYYTLLILSSVIIAAGLIVENAAVVIGGMMVTPVLTPILLISLGVSVGDVDFIKKTTIFVLKSLAVVLLGSFILGILFGLNGDTPGLFNLDDTLRGAVLYFVVALAAGFSATLAWVRKQVNEILPGIAVAVALVPPLALVGLGLSVFNIEVIRSNFFVFFFNFLGVLVGSLLVFSLLKFYKIEKKIEEKGDE